MLLLLLLQMKERVVQQEMVKIYRERMAECYQKEKENFPQLCRKQIMDYWKAFNDWKKKGQLPFVFI